MDKALKKGKKNLKYSRYIISINPLVPKLASSDYTEESLREKLEQSKRIFTKANIKPYIYFATQEKHTFESHILDVTSEGVIEDGNSMRVGLHIHIYCEIKHNSNIRLNFQKIRAVLKKLFNKTVHFNARIIRSSPERNDIQTVLQYIRKNSSQKDALPKSKE